MSQAGKGANLDTTLKIYSQFKDTFEFPRQNLEHLQARFSTRGELEVFLSRLNDKQRKSCFNFLQNFSLDALPQLSTTLVSPAERWQNLFSIFLHYITHINPHQIIDFSQFTKNLTLIYNKCPEFVTDLLGYQDLESLLADNYYSKNQQTKSVDLWTKLRFLIYVKPENLNFLFARSEQPTVIWSDLLLNILQNPDCLLALINLPREQLELLLTKGIFPFDLPNYSCKLNHVARKFITSIITDNTIILINLLLFIKHKLLSADWLNKFLQQDLTSTDLAGSPDKNELLKRFSKEELAALEEELENSMVKDLPPNLLDKGYPDNPEGGIALATDDTKEYRLPASSQGKSGESKSSEEKLKIFLAAWNPEILTEEKLRSLTPEIISKLANNPDIVTKNFGLIILYQLLLTLDLDSQDLLSVIRSSHLQLLITNTIDSYEKLAIFTRILELISNKNTKQEIVQILDSDFLHSIFLLYNKLSLKEWRFLENFAQLINQELITLADLLRYKSQKTSFLEFVETINRLTEAQIKTIINRLKAQNEKKLLDLLSQIDAIPDTDLDTYINNFFNGLSNRH